MKKIVEILKENNINIVDGKIALADLTKAVEAINSKTRVVMEGTDPRPIKKDSGDIDVDATMSRVKELLDSVSDVSVFKTDFDAVDDDGFVYYTVEAEGSILSLKKLATRMGLDKSYVDDVLSNR